jgi:hypothetical protein
MKQIGRKIYYDVSTGTVLCDTGERQGAVVETTQSDDFSVYPQLTEVDPATIGVIQMAYGERADEFANMVSMSVDPATGILIITPQTVVADGTTTSA